MGPTIFSGIRPEAYGRIEMNEATIALTVMTLLIFLIFAGFLVWGIKSGQFKNIEEAKYQVFRKQKQDEVGPGEEDEKDGD